RGPVFAVSSPLTPVAALADGWRKASLGAGTLRRLSRVGRYAPFEQTRVAVALDVVHQAVATNLDLFDSLLEPLASEGRSNDLVETLATTLREEGSISRAATLLQLHQNSVRYRVQKIRESLSVDLDEPEARLALRLATSRLQNLPPPGREL